MQKDTIYIKGAKEHNLKNIDLEIPRDKLVVFTGLSGSGKSSLAFDTIYAEGQRRYVESLSSYARQFLGQMEKPEVELIEGLSPAISIDQKTTAKNPRSTVGTVTEIYDYLRVLYARIGIPHCPVCGREIKQQTTDQITDAVLNMPQGTKSWCWHQWYAPAKESTSRSLRMQRKAAMSVSGQTATFMISPRRSNWTKTKNTISRSSSTVWWSRRKSASGWLIRSKRQPNCQRVW